jgi:hypothetical protein
MPGKALWEKEKRDETWSVDSISPLPQQMKEQMKGHPLPA